MTIGIIASLIAFIAYGGLVFLVQQKGIKSDLTNRAFFLYLLDMLLMQISYLGISTAQSASRALFWYSLHVPFASAQVIIYFFFVRSFLGIKSSKNLIRSTLFIWLSVLVSSFIFRSNLFISIYKDPGTGMFLPKIGMVAVLLSIPTLIFLVATLFELSKHYRNQSRPQQARIQYLFLSILIVWVGIATNIQPTLQPYAVDVIANIVSAILIAYAILKYQLLELNTVLRRGLEVFTSVLVFGAGNIILIFPVGKLLHIEIDATSLLFIITLSTLTLMALIPLRDRIQRNFGQTLFKTTYDGYAMIQRLSHTATHILDLEELSTLLLNEVVNTLQAQWGVLLVKQRDNSFKPIAWEKVTDDFLFSLNQNHIILNWMSKEKTNNAVYNFSELPKQITLPVELGNPNLIGSELLPLKIRGELVGIVWLGAKLKERPYSQDDKTNLIAVANNIAATINNALLYEERKRINTQLAHQLEEIQTLQEDLRRQVVRDPLTGLFNRRYLYETFDRELARAKRKNYPISVIMIDLDYFKEINDTHGHQVGDEVLEALGSLLINITRRGDIACRYGGDEFLVIMPGTCEKDAKQRAKAIGQRIKTIAIQPGAKNIILTASIGIALYPNHGDNLDDIMKASDDALYEAKNAGRNRIAISN